MKFNYQELVQRNLGYIETNTQNKIAQTKILIAGCGIGSTIAEAAVRMGFRNFILVDGDEVSLSNLNRQAYRFEDVGTLKTTALAKALRAINPEVEIQEVPFYLNAENIHQYVESSDLVFDTIDFLDLPAILALHDQCLLQKKPLITAVSAGWGAAAMFVPASDRKVSWFREFFSVPEELSASVTHSELYARFFMNLAPHLDPTILTAMSTALKVMEDGKPCPAPQVSAGAFAVASLAVTMAYRFLSGKPISAAPDLMLIDQYGITARSGITIGGS